jgi:hypothetical protein
MTEKDVPTLFDWVGGMPALERLFDTFYARTGSDKKDEPNGQRTASSPTSIRNSGRASATT